MSASDTSTNVTFKNGDIGYEPTFDGKFIDQLYQLMLNGNSKEVKKMISDIRSDREKIDNENDVIGMADEFSDNEDYDEFACENNIESRLADIVLPNGFKPLILAAQIANPELVKYFISLGFDVNAKDSKSSVTPLLAACSSICNKNPPNSHAHNVKTCILLLKESDANLSFATVENNEFPLHLLASNNYLEACEYLLSFVDNVDCRNDRRSTPLMLAASKGHTDMVKLLLNANADKSLRNISGMSSVELAMVNDHEDIVRLLVTDTDNLEFYRAWSVIHRELINDSNTRNIRQSFLRNFNTKYQDDPLGYMCTNLNLPHLQPIFDRNGVTFSHLLCMSDSDLKNIGIVRFADRKCLLNAVQDIHKFPWNHETSIYSPDFRKPVKPNEYIDMNVTVKNHLELMTSTLTYLRQHLTVNAPYYDNEPRIKSYLDKISNHCELSIRQTDDLRRNIAKTNGFFDKMYEHALDEDVSSKLDDEGEMRRQHKLANKYSRLVKTGVVVSVLSGVLVVLWRGLR